MKLRTDFTSRDDLSRYVSETFGTSGDPSPDFTGGRTEALRRLHSFSLHGYAAKRNLTEVSAVSMLSPYIRHGVMTLAEVRRFVLGKFGQGKDTYKFIFELAWRHFFQLVYAASGDKIYRDMETGKTGVSKYDGILPQDVAEARTGLRCMDYFMQKLLATGYLHNHERMWFASYLVHHRRVDWLVGERLFYKHLIDGDPASNALSWQWVASTFSAKPYIFNKEVLERCTDGVHCKVCEVKESCPFNFPPGVLEERLFGKRFEQ
ncbi:MAG: DNA photolyase [Rhizobacter sp.]|nr:DNA photolyase [Chlorobiales bacterium]